MPKVLVAILAAASLALLAGCGGTELENHTLTLTAPGDDSELATVDEAERGSSSGDHRTFSQPLFEEGSDEPAGRLDGAVHTTATGKRDGLDVEYRTGTTQITLDEGTLIYAGTYIAEPGSGTPIEEGVERAIVGGTGAYRGASGEITSTPEGEDFRYELDFDTPSD